jgi:putative effector of murein hydrolase
VSATTVLSLAFTLAVYVAAERLARRVRSPWTNPVGLTVVAGIALVALGPASLPAYERGTARLVWALRPAVVALGWLAYLQRDVLRRWAGPLLVGSTVGSTVSLLATPLLARWAGADPVLQTALALKSVTSAVGVDLAGRVGADAALTVPLVIVTGVLGAAFGPPLLRALGVEETAAGIALGTNSHGIGTAALAGEGRAAGAALSGLAMAVTAVASGVLAPLALALLGLP